jgi:hypothetical protein
MVIVEKLFDWRLAGETEVLGENLPQRHEAPTFSRESAHRCRWVVSLTCRSAGRFLTPRIFLVPISVRRWIDPRPIVQLERLGWLKNPMTPRNKIILKRNTKLQIMKQWNANTYKWLRTNKWARPVTVKAMRQTRYSSVYPFSFRFNGSIEAGTFISSLLPTAYVSNSNNVEFNVSWSSYPVEP